MTLIIRIFIAVLVGVLVDALLNYFGLLTDHINALLGLLAALLVFFNYDGTLPGRRVA